MEKIIARIVDGPGAPMENDLWLDGTTLKKYENGKWEQIAGGGGGTPSSQVQADWNQTDNTKPDYIKNKPYVMIVRGVFYSSGTNIEGPEFVSNSDSPSSYEALQHFKNGGDVLLIDESATFPLYFRVCSMSVSGMEGHANAYAMNEGNSVYWCYSEDAS